MTTQNPSKPYFETVADQWDQIRGSYFTEALRDAVIGKAHLHPDMIVADVGAGTGYMSAGLAPRVSAVHVVDGSPLRLDSTLARYAAASAMARLAERRSTA